jgi:hypothetical protein
LLSWSFGLWNFRQHQAHKQGTQNEHDGDEETTNKGPRYIRILEQHRLPLLIFVQEKEPRHGKKFSFKFGVAQIWKSKRVVVADRIQMQFVVAQLVGQGVLEFSLRLSAIQDYMGPVSNNRRDPANLFWKIYKADFKTSPFQGTGRIFQ